jgi:hypothetical protein
MHEVDEAFYRYTIQQRDMAWREIEVLTAERSRLKAERDAYIAAAKRISAEKQATINMLDAALASDDSYVRLKAERDRLFTELKATLDGLTRFMQHEPNDGMALIKVIMSDIHAALEEKNNQ